jgi:Xaa-Pro aminopeptidase
MRRGRSRLTEHLQQVGADGFLVDADGDDSDQYYLSGYHAPDAFVTLFTDDQVVTLVSGMEYTRANTDSAADEVRKRAEFGYREYAEQMDPRKAEKVVVADFLDEYGVESVSVPVSFPSGAAGILNERGVEVTAGFEYVVDEIRAVKTDEEVDYVRQTQRANEAAMGAAEAMLDDATVEDGVLHLDGAVLTSERVRREIERTLLDENCGMDQCIVACGPDAARAHESGSGPLAADTPIVVDIFPRHKETRYFGDMTRTFVKGDPSDQVREWYDLTLEAFEASLDAIAAGVSGEAVYDATCEVFEAADYPTRRTHDAPENGFFHSTGHGVGLEVHESPYLAQEAGDLEAGHVVTVEPGLYQQGVGGVRVEDLVVVTEDGYENLTDYPTDLRVL